MSRMCPSWRGLSPIRRHMWEKVAIFGQYRDHSYWFPFKNGPISNGYWGKCVLCVGLLWSWKRVMDHGDFECWGFKKVWGHYDVINEGQRKTIIFFDLTLRLELILDGYWTDLRTEKRFQETDNLGVFCYHLGYDTAPRGFVRRVQKWGKVLARAFLRAN